MTTDYMHIQRVISNGIILRDHMPQLVQHCTDNGFDLMDFTSAEESKNLLDKITVEKKMKVVYDSSRVTISSVFDAVTAVILLKPDRLPLWFSSIKHMFLFDDHADNLSFLVNFGEQKDEDVMICSGNTVVSGLHKCLDVLRRYPEFDIQKIFTNDERISITASRPMTNNLMNVDSCDIPKVVNINNRCIWMMPVQTEETQLVVADGIMECLLRVPKIFPSVIDAIVNRIFATREGTTNNMPNYIPVNMILGLDGVVDAIMLRFSELKQTIRAYPDLINGFTEIMHGQGNKIMSASDWDDLQLCAIRGNSMIIRHLRKQTDRFKLAAIENNYDALAAMQRLNTSFIDLAREVHPDIDEELAKYH